MKRSSVNGLYGYAGIALAVGAFDTINEQTMTESYQNALEHPYKRIIALGGMAITCSHLLGLIPDKVDPFNIVANNVGKLAGKVFDGE